MFWPFRRRSKPKTLTPRWTVALTLLVILIALMSGKKNHQPEALVDAQAKPLLDFSQYKQAIFPEQQELKIRQLQPGSGAPAICGQDVTLHIRIYDTSGHLLDEKPNAEIRLGDGKTLPAIERGVTGMQKGEKRSLLSPPTLAYAAKGFTREDIAPSTAVIIQLELLGADPDIADPETEFYRITTSQEGSGKLVLCGEASNFHVTLWDMTGKKIYAGVEPLRFTPGNSDIAFGLEQGVIGMRTGGMRTLIIPPAYQTPMRQNAEALKLPWPKNQVVIADVEALN